VAPPVELLDAHLLKLFGFRKSLEEIDAMDFGRLQRALEALTYAEAWKRHHTPKPTMGASDKAKAAFRKARDAEAERAQRDEDFKRVDELLQLMAEFYGNRG